MSRLYPMTDVQTFAFHARGTGIDPWGRRAGNLVPLLIFTLGNFFSNTTYYPCYEDRVKMIRRSEVQLGIRWGALFVSVIYRSNELSMLSYHISRSTISMLHSFVFMLFLISIAIGQIHLSKHYTIYR